MSYAWRWRGCAISKPSLLPDDLRRGVLSYLSASRSREDRLSSGADPTLGSLIVVPISDSWSDEVPCKVGDASSPDWVTLGEGADERDGGGGRGPKCRPDSNTNRGDISDIILRRREP